MASKKNGLPKLTAHPKATIFPPMDKERFEALKEDLKTRGQVAPILIKGTQILDGINRYAALEEIGADEIWTEEFQGEDIVGEIIARNILRRDLTDDQRVACVAQLRGESLAKAAKKRQAGGKDGDKGEVADVVAKEAKVSQHKGRAALETAKHAPEELEEVIQGKKKLADAAKVAKAKKAARAPKPRKAPEPKPLEDVVKKRFLSWIDYWPVSEHRKVKAILKELI
jgi:hypothetical protein